MRRESSGSKEERARVGGKQREREREEREGMQWTRLKEDMEGEEDASERGEKVGKVH